MFSLKKDLKNHQMIEGIEMSTLNHGDITLMAEFRIKKGAALPEHSHPYEQTGYLVEGELKLNINGEEMHLHQGDSWNIPKDIPHSAVAETDCKAIEVFSPVREDYLKMF